MSDPFDMHALVREGRIRQAAGKIGPWGAQRAAELLSALEARLPDVPGHECDCGARVAAERDHVLRFLLGFTQSDRADDDIVTAVVAIAAKAFADAITEGEHVLDARDAEDSLQGAIAEGFMAQSTSPGGTTSYTLTADGLRLVQELLQEAGLDGGAPRRHGEVSP